MSYRQLVTRYWILAISISCDCECNRDFSPTAQGYRGCSNPNARFVHDDIEGRNSAHAATGKPSGLYIFQEGTFLSAIRLSDQTFVTLTKDYAAKTSFGSLDDWYLRALRAEFGERY